MLYEMMDPGEWDTQWGIGSYDIYRNSVWFCKMMSPDEWDIRCGIGLRKIHRFSTG